MGGKRKRRGSSSAMSIEDIIANEDALQICMMGNLRGVKQSRILRDFENCEGYDGLKKLKKAVSLNFGHIEFDNKEQKDKTLRAIKDIIIRNKPVKFSIKREQIREIKRPRLNAEDIDIQDIVTPLWRKSYEDQLKHKARFVNRTLYHITKKTKEDSKHSIPQWIQKIDKMRGPCCDYDLTVVPSPIIHNYRNKSSFTAGLDINGKPTLGFALGALKDNIDCIGDPTSCSHISLRSLEIRNIVNNYITNSKLNVYNKCDHTGFWRRLTVRTFTTNEGMVIIEANPSNLSEEEIENEKKALIRLFEENNINESLFYLPWSGVSNFANEDIKIQCLRGEPYAHELLYDLKFRVSPGAFFQVNTKGTHVLYDIIRDWCNISKKSTVIDICCGTGSISLCLAKSIKNIVGVEMNKEAVKNAELNAKLNGIENATFIAGKAEDVVPDLLSKYESCEEFIAVVDPPRAGLHKSVIKAIRDNSFINKLVYVSCDHTNGLLHNATALCRATSNSSPGIPFKPIKVTAVDMFPHTDCVEVVMLFERDTTENKEQNDDNTKKEENKPVEDNNNNQESTKQSIE